MTRPRPRREPVQPITGDRPIIPSTLRVLAVEDVIKKTVSQGMSKRLNVAQAALPDDLKAVIATTSAAAAQRAVELSVLQDVNEAVGAVSRSSTLGRFDDRIAIAAKGLVHISESDDVTKIMTKRADMLAKKKKALETSGFSSEEAMQILLADIAARGH